MVVRRMRFMRASSMYGPHDRHLRAATRPRFHRACAADLLHVCITAGEATPRQHVRPVESMPVVEHGDQQAVAPGLYVDIRVVLARMTPHVVQCLAECRRRGHGHRLRRIRLYARRTLDRETERARRITY